MIHKRISEGLDPGFRQRPWRYVAQCAIATGIILVVLIVLDSVSQTVLIAALGASTFIAFTMPHTTRSHPRFLIGGYAVGIAVGTLASVLSTSFAQLTGLDIHASDVVLAAAAVGVSALIMVVTDTEHPPAAALALGFVLNDWNLMTIAVVMVGIVSIAASKEAARRYLIDLL